MGHDLIRAWGEWRGGDSVHQQTTLRAAEARRGPARYTQAQIDQFVAAHERFVQRQPKGLRAIMRFLQAPSIDFNRRLLSDADFTGANMAGASFILTDLQRASFYCADLRRADLRRANLARADLRGASLRAANLSGARLDDADMRQAILAKTDLDGRFGLAGRSGQAASEEGERVFGVDFTNCSMKRVRLGNAKLKGANFSGALLHGADLKGAQLEGARFDGAVLIGVDVETLNLPPAVLAKCVTDPSPAARDRAPQLLAILAQAELWSTSSGTQGAAAHLEGEDLRPLVGVFEKRALTAMNARGVQAIGVSFAGAQLQGANFDEADLRDADFTAADLRGATFRGANLWHARFTNADLRALRLASGLKGVDFTGASLDPDALAVAQMAG